MATSKAEIAQIAATIGKRARLARTALGFTQREVARDVGYVPEVYGRVERGGEVPRLPALLRIAGVLRVTPNFLLGYDDALPASRLQPPAELRRILGLLARADPAVLRALLGVARVMVRMQERSGRGRTQPR
jgi:transcriptional regulator with XRE-family HTH domain